MSEEFVEESAELAVESAQQATEASGEHRAAWVEWASLSTMFMAVVSAISGLLAGKTGNESIVERQQQVSSLVELNRMDLEMEILLTRLVVLQSSGKPAPQGLLDRIKQRSDAMERYEREQSTDLEISESALQTHELFALGTTVISIAITLCGMAVIVRRKPIWFAGLLISGFGTAVVIWGMIQLWT